MTILEWVGAIAVGLVVVVLLYPVACLAMFGAMVLFGLAMDDDKREKRR
jgi:hypothetical protein